MQKNDKNNETFENIRHIDENGIEFWYARELSLILEYKEWRNFNKVLNKAKEACKNSGFIIENDFVEFNKIVAAGATSKKLLIINYLDMLVI